MKGTTLRSVRSGTTFCLKFGLTISDAFSVNSSGFTGAGAPDVRRSPVQTGAPVPCRGSGSGRGLCIFNCRGPGPCRGAKIDLRLNTGYFLFFHFETLFSLLAPSD